MKKRDEEYYIKIINELRSNHHSMYLTNQALIKKLSKIIDYSREFCDAYMYIVNYGGYVAGSFDKCKKVLELAGEDISKYE